MTYYADVAQQEVLKKLDKMLDAGKLDHVRDTPEYWKKYTTVEMAYILRRKHERQKVQRGEG